MLNSPFCKCTADNLFQNCYRVLRFPGVAGLLNDFYMYEPANITWTDLSVAVSGIPPSPRDGLGFTFAGGKIYVHGGFGSNGACARINT